MGFAGDSCPTSDTHVERVWRTQVVPVQSDWYTEKMAVEDKMADIQK